MSIGGSSSDQENGLTIAIGRLWTQERFTDQATQCAHPFDKEQLVPPRVAKALLNQARLGPTKIKEKRKEALLHYARRAKDLEEGEKELHSKLNPNVETVVHRKRILLFKEMLADIEYDDQQVADLLISGIDLVGRLPKVGIWKPLIKEPSCSIKTLWANAKRAQQDDETIGGPSEYDSELWKLTMKEVEGGG